MFASRLGFVFTDSTNDQYSSLPLISSMYIILIVPCVEKNFRYLVLTVDKKVKSKIILIDKVSKII